MALRQRQAEATASWAPVGSLTIGMQKVLEVSSRILRALFFQVSMVNSILDNIIKVIQIQNFNNIITQLTKAFRQKLAKIEDLSLYHILSPLFLVVVSFSWFQLDYQPQFLNSTKTSFRISFEFLNSIIIPSKKFYIHSKRQIINIPMTQKKKVSSICKFHNSKCIQIGSCITCTSSCTICQTKGCIKHHQENQRIHNVHTIEYVRHIVSEYVNTDQTRKLFLKKMVTDYFQLAKKQLQKLYNMIYEAIDRFKFDTVILHQEEKRIAELLIEERFSEVSCSDIANVLPKLIKCTNYEDGHFTHIRSYLRTEKEKLPNMINTMILNLPYFRQYDKESTMTKFCQISDNSLKEINRKIIALNYRPKKLRIKYSTYSTNCS